MKKHTQGGNNMDKEYFDIRVDLKSIDKEYVGTNLPTMFFRALNYEQFMCYINILTEMHKRGYFDIDKITIN